MKPLITTGHAPRPHGEYTEIWHAPSHVPGRTLIVQSTYRHGAFGAKVIGGFP